MCVQRGGGWGAGWVLAPGSTARLGLLSCSLNSPIAKQAEQYLPRVSRHCRRGGGVCVSGWQPSPVLSSH